MLKKSSKQYQFRVFVICNGDCYGLLMEKYEPLNPVPQYAYFWREGDGGLAPTDEIKKHCMENCHKLQSSEKYKPKTHRYAQCRDQELIFLELLDYAKWAASNNYSGPEVTKEKNLRIDYETYDKKKNYAGILSRFFSKEGSLRDFLIDSEIYTSYVLESPYGRDTVIGKAIEFGFRDLHNPLPDKNLVYLQGVEKLLKVENHPAAEWFRPDGPLFSDFEDKRVYRRSVLDDLEKTVFERPAYLLKGDVATGKSVIVRHLMYEFFKEGYTRTYCFDISGYRAFNRETLLREILNVTGIIIVENVHIEPEKMNWVLSQLPADEERHLLLTSRKSIDNFKGLFNEAIHRVESTELKVFDEADEIVNCFVSHSETSATVSDRRTKILEVSKGNFWLLSFALQGCDDAKGKGEPKSWVASRVNKYLMSLKELHEDKYYREYPRIVLALCPLYKNEVLTEQSFLVNNLHLNEDAIEDLARRGEIKYQKDAEGNIFYGLSHSTLADAYWEHGQIHNRSKLQYDGYLLAYLNSDVHNGIRLINALLNKCYNINNSVVEVLCHRLRRQNLFANIIKNETSIESITEWVDYKLNVGHYDFSFDDMRAISNRLLETNNWEAISKCIYVIFKKFRLGYMMWLLLDKKMMAKKLCITKTFWGPYLFLCNLYYRAPECALDICRELDLKKITASILSNSEDPYWLYYCASISGSNKEVGRKIWKSLHMDAVNIIQNGKDIEKICESLAIIGSTDKKIFWELWNSIDKTAFIDKISSLPMKILEKCLAFIYHVNRPAIQRIICQIKKRKTKNFIESKLPYMHEDAVSIKKDQRYNKNKNRKHARHNEQIKQQVTQALYSYQNEK